MARKKEEKQYIDNSTIIDTDIVSDVEKSFIDYSMSVLCDRAIPRLEDGCKPIHRRILYDMDYTKAHPDKPYKKVSRLVGSIMGRLHAHGDSSIEGALVRFGQDWNMRYPLVEIHGNAGSIDGDPHAAGRYIEGRLTPLAMTMVADIDKDTVDFQPNFDGEEVEPVVLPSRLPNLLLNGSNGIAVGFTTNIPPHNLSDVVDSLVYLIDNGKKYNFDELLKIIKGPDFPTGAQILGKDGIIDMYKTGRGSITMRAKCDIEKLNAGKHAIIVSEIPYNVNKAKLVEKMAELVKLRKIVGISEIRDESSREGLRIYIEVKKDVNPEIVLNKLYKLSDLQCNFSAVVLVLYEGVPQIMKLDEILLKYLDFQKEVVRRRTEFDLKKAKERAHILEGLLIALDNIDEVIRIIRSSTNDAKERLMKSFSLSEVQAQAILDMRLARLQKLEADKLRKELAALKKDIKRFESILKSEKKLLNVIRTELLDMKEQFGDKRRTQILKGEDGNIEVEEIVEAEDCYLTITAKGYINRISSDKYEKLKEKSALLSNDFINKIIPVNTHGTLLGFTNKGNLYRIPVYKINESKSETGENLRDVLEVMLSEKIVGLVYTLNYDSNETVLVVSSDGQIKKLALSDLVSNNKSIIFTKLKNDASVVFVGKDNGADVILITNERKTIRFSSEPIRVMGRTAVGSNAITLQNSDYVTNVLFFKKGIKIGVLSSNGYIKQFPASDIKVQGRAGKGISLCDTSKLEKFGSVVDAITITDNCEVCAIDDDDIIKSISDIPIETRTGLGKKLLIGTEKIFSNSI